MAQIELTHSDIENVLSTQRIVRVCFSTADEKYLLPLGYYWADGALYLMMAAGQKTRMALANPRVAFQVDDAAERGMLDWSSVTGEGELIPLDHEADQKRVAIALLAKFPELAQWGAGEASRKATDASLLFARLVPRWMTGRRFSVSGVASG